MESAARRSRRDPGHRNEISRARFSVTAPRVRRCARLDCDVHLVPGADLYMVNYTAAATSDAGKLELLRVTGGRAVQTGPDENGVPTFT